MGSGGGGSGGGGASVNSGAPFPAELMEGINREFFADRKAAGKIPASMTIEEFVSINTYSGSAYITVNNELRDGRLSPIIKALVDKLNTGLDKLPPFRGQVFRGVNFSGDQKAFDAFMNMHNVGENVKFSSMVSTSKLSEIAKDFTTFSRPTANPTSVLFNITSKSGRDITSISNQPGEHEVLFKSGSKFRVVSKRVDGSIVRIKLKEI